MMNRWHPPRRPRAGHRRRSWPVFLYFFCRGCDVTLLISRGNVALAKVRAVQEGLPKRLSMRRERGLPRAVEDLFDHVFLMGLMYHLLEEGPTAYGPWSRRSPAQGGRHALQVSVYPAFLRCDLRDEIPARNAAGSGGASLSADVSVIPPTADPPSRRPISSASGKFALLSCFPLEKLHLFGQEGIFPL